MKNSIKRTIKSRQIGLVQTYHQVDGTSGSPVDSGLDKAFVESVTKNGTGDYTIKFIEPARMDVFIASLVSLTPGAILDVAAVGKDTVTIGAQSDAGAAMDADFNFVAVHSKLIDALF